MPNDLKNEWKENGIALGHAFRDLAKTFVKSGAAFVKKAEEWANEDEKKNETTDKTPDDNAE